jgi:hypothetical protein
MKIHRSQEIRNTTDQLRSIDVRKLRRLGLIGSAKVYNWRWSRNGIVVAFIEIHARQNSLVLSYNYQRGDKEQLGMSYPIALSWTICNLGGQRPWFLCPNECCGRRVALLYFNGMFVCRQCCNLAYPCQREQAADRAARRADRVRENLGWKQGILNGTGVKPKGMHWKTFFDLSSRHNEWATVALSGLASRLNLSPNYSE